jgi:RNA polymerase primary sigma factor
MSIPFSSDKEDGIPSFLNRLTLTPLLKAEEEAFLSRAMKAGDEKARRKMIEANMRLVINIAKGYKSQHISTEDLIQEGAIGLMHAADRFDPDRGFRFSTYATHWIRQSIGRALDNKSKAIRIPAHVTQTLRRAERERIDYVQENGYEPTLGQLALRLNISLEKLQTVYASSLDVISLDLPVGDANAQTLGGMIADSSENSPEKCSQRAAIQRELQEIIRELDVKEQDVMFMKFRADGVEFSTEEMASALGMSRDRVKKIEVQAIKKLRIIAERKRLREIL